MHSELWLRSQCDPIGQTVLADCFYTPPLKILTIPNSYHTIWPHALQVMQMSSSPGLLDGDKMDMHLTLEAGSRLQLSTQAFTRVQSMPFNGEAQQHMVFILQPESRLYYVPHPLVLHRDAALVQTTEIYMAERSVLLLGEIIACGRTLNQERWQFRSLSATLQISYQQQKMISDNIQWQPRQQTLDVLGQMEHFSHQASLHYVHAGINQRMLVQLSNQLHEFLATDWPIHDHSCLWGLSQSSTYGICLRALGEGAQTLQQLLQQAAQWLALQTDMVTD